jgi:hypothetical protein
MVTQARRRCAFLLIAALTLSSVLFAGFWLGAARAGSSRATAASFSNVKMTKFDAIDGGGSGCAPSPDTFNDVPGAGKTFKVAGTADRPVLVTVSLQASTNAANDFDGFVRLLIDGDQQGVGQLQQSGDGGVRSATLSYTFLTRALVPGNHTAKIQFAGGVNAFCIDHWTLAILHV